MQVREFGGREEVGGLLGCHFFAEWSAGWTDMGWGVWSRAALA